MSHAISRNHRSSNVYDHGVELVVTDLEGRIVNVISNMFALGRALSTLCRCSKKHGLSKSMEINLDYEIDGNKFGLRNC